MFIVSIFLVCDIKFYFVGIKLLFSKIKFLLFCYQVSMFVGINISCYFAYIAVKHIGITICRHHTVHNLIPTKPLEETTKFTHNLLQDMKLSTCYIVFLNLINLWCFLAPNMDYQVSVHLAEGFQRRLKCEK